ncbi:MAG: sigma-54-dependent Fis family transcriptional regulator, partial [Nitrospirae bacterium]|nr:sigma-54-dependent Fis family transcriptional regulator [Nitrospirota bacterium]
VFQEHNWPGNVRELKNIVERLMIMTKSPVIAISDIPKSFKSDISYQDSAAHEAKRYDSFKDAVNDFEKEYITTILKENEWNISKTADVLQLDRSHLHRKIKALNIIFPVY